MKISRRNLLAGTGALALALPQRAEAWFRHGKPSPSGATSYQQLKMGGGGFVTSLNISPDGSMKVVGTDCAMGYIWNSGTNTWDQLVTQSSMPADDFGYYFPNGSDSAMHIYEQNGQWTGGQGWVDCVACAPGTPTTLYMKYNGRVFKSTNSGTTWATTNYGILITSAVTTSPAGTAILYFDSALPEWLSDAVASHTTNGFPIYVRNRSDYTSIEELYYNSVMSINTGAKTITIGGGSALSIQNAGIGVNAKIALYWPNEWGLRTTSSHYIAVDPNNADIVYVGSSAAGLQKTMDGGTTWTTIPSSSIPTVTWGYYKIAIDPSNSNNIYVFAVGSAVLGNGNFSGISYTPAGGGTHMYASTDGGSTWSATTGGPAGCYNFIVSPTSGIVWACGLEGYLWKYSSGTWTSVLTDGGSPSGSGQNGYFSVAIDPSYSSPNERIVSVTTNGPANFSLNSGSAWGGLPLGSQGAPGPGNYGTTRAAGDTPWLSVTNQNFLGMFSAAYDPSQSHVIIGTNGIGVWTMVGPTSSNAPGTATQWTALTSGIENMQVDQIRCPSGGKPIVALGDRFVFSLDVSNNVNQTTCSLFSQSKTLGSGVALDYAEGTRSFLAIINNYFFFVGWDLSGYSTDDGATFYPFNNYLVSVPSSTLSQGAGSGANHLIRVDLTSVGGTSGLTSWVAGSGDILSVLSLNGQGLAGYSGGELYYPITVIDGNHIDLQQTRWENGGTFSPYNNTGANYLIYRNTNPFSDMNGQINVTGTSDSGAPNHYIRVALTGNFSAWSFNGVSVKITGAVGATDINGTWIVAGSNGSTYIDLYGTTWASNTWISGGSLSAYPMGISGAIAVSTPSKILRISVHPGYQTVPYYTSDGGQSWAKVPLPAANTQIITTGGTGGTSTLNFASVPAWVVSGMTFTISSGGGYTVSSVTSNTIVVYGTLSGTVSSGAVCVFDSGWPHSISTNAFIIAADRAVSDVFYMFNRYQGIYQMVNGVTPSGPRSTSTTFTFAADYNLALKTVPGQSGHLFFCPNRVAGGYNLRLWRSIDGGRTMVIVPNFWNPVTIAFGAPKPGNSYPAIYVVGFYGTTLANSTFGIYRCDNDGNAGLGGYNDNSTPSPATPGTWTNVGSVGSGGTAAGTYAGGIYDYIRDIEGDPITWGQFYVSTWSGVMMGKVS